MNNVQCKTEDEAHDPAVLFFVREGTRHDTASSEEVVKKSFWGSAQVGLLLGASFGWVRRASG